MARPQSLHWGQMDEIQSLIGVYWIRNQKSSEAEIKNSLFLMGDFKMCILTTKNKEPVELQTTWIFWGPSTRSALYTTPLSSDLVISWLCKLPACHIFSCYFGTWLLDLDCHVLLSFHLFNSCLLNCPRPHFCSKSNFPQSEARSRHPIHLAALPLTSPVFKKWNVISLLTLLLLKADFNSIQISWGKNSFP